LQPMVKIPSVRVSKKLLVTLNKDEISRLIVCIGYIKR
jgi:hypothetical protein